MNSQPQQHVADRPDAAELSPRRGSWRRLILLMLAVLCVLVIAAELVLRFGLGLGNPPRYLHDAELEYIAEPSSAYRRFGNRIAFNEWSMRSPDFPKRKTATDELRVLVLGDSIVNGGTHISQEDLATELLVDRLAEATNRPVTIGNIAAPSWGPANLLAYVNRYGTFDADIAIIVLNSSDAWDVPSENVKLPDGGMRPNFALEELARKAYERFTHNPPAFQMTGHTMADIAQAMSALRELIEALERAGIRVAVVQHLFHLEVVDVPSEGTFIIRREMIELGTPLYSTHDAYTAAMNETDEPLYVDRVHLRPRGQRALADVLFDTTMELLNSATMPSP